MPVLLIAEADLPEEAYADIAGKMTPLIREPKGLIFHAGRPDPAGGCWPGVLLGRGARRELLKRGLALKTRAGPAVHPHPGPLTWFQCVDDIEGTRARHAREDSWARGRGDDRMRAERLGYPAMVELQAGQWGPGRAARRAQLRNARTGRCQRTIRLRIRLAVIDRCLPGQDRPCAHDPSAARRGGSADGEGMVGSHPAQRGGFCGVLDLPGRELPSRARRRGASPDRLASAMRSRRWPGSERRSVICARQSCRRTSPSSASSRPHRRSSRGRRTHARGIPFERISPALLEEG
jgi:hypothetical protein